jgi:hypothetical protein
MSLKLRLLRRKNRLLHREGPNALTSSFADQGLPESPVDAEGSSRATLPSHGRAPKHKGGPLGLTVLFEPEGELPSADIVFVHGLRGGSEHTWSFNDDPKLFWPQEWLPNEPTIRSARISTFGYDSDYLAAGKKKGLSITDFARELLSSLRVSPAEKDGLGYGKVCGDSSLDVEAEMCWRRSILNMAAYVHTERGERCGTDISI